jgi:hypothetical protein
MPNQRQQSGVHASHALLPRRANGGPGPFPEILADYPQPLPRNRTRQAVALCQWPSIASGLERSLRSVWGLVENARRPRRAEGDS